MSYAPTASTWTTFKKGQSGWKVWALQLNLPVAADGVFGDKTEQAVKEIQRAAGLTVDGIAGPSTQQYLVLFKSKAYEFNHNLPSKLLQGVAENESGNYIACVSGVTADGGRDYGTYQDHRVAVSDAILAHSFSISWMASVTADKIRTQKDLFYNRAKSTTTIPDLTHQRAWELATLYHNWPYAADRLAKGLSIYATPGADDQPKQWIIDATKGRLSTPNQWVNSYIAKATVYVTEWPA